MLKTISDKVVFAQTTPQELFDLYLNQELHEKVTNSKVTISDKEGDTFNAYEGYCSGKNLLIQAGKYIVQTWKAANWEVESIFSMRFEYDGDDTHLYWTHTDIPADDAESIKSGWYQYYFDLWTEYLKDKVEA